MDYFVPTGDSGGSEGHSKRGVSSSQSAEKQNRSSLKTTSDLCPIGGIRGRSFPQVLFAVAFATAISYRGLELPQFPVSDSISPKCKRNAEICARHQKGESIVTLAEAFGITEQRIWQILNDRRK